MQGINWKYGSPVSDEIIRSIEVNLDVVFPIDYRALISEHNGGRPKPNAIDIPGRREAVMERLLRIDSDGGENVANTATILKSRSQGDLVPFACDPFGNLFCFKFVGKTQSAVVYWEHESGSVSTICKTFSELLGLLRHPRR